MAKRNPFLIWGILAVLFGLVMLLVPAAENRADTPAFPTYWWISGPALAIGLVLMAMGRRRYLATKERPVGDEHF